jgi:hypothetical protein
LPRSSYGANTVVSMSAHREAGRTSERWSQGLARLAVLFGEEFAPVLVLAASEVSLTGASIDTADAKGRPFDSLFTNPASANHEVHTMPGRTAAAGRRRSARHP